ncbi:uncharacterized protein LOC134259528 [Saccostrea cucullata]|uniref:uncharacterized protein LOC134259528 n=1 Tax=Saccostrea cuccullata TaxID=36930 RepID=UPI002ECFEA53
MDTNVPQCSQCMGKVEFYCRTCNQDLCDSCKEKHVIDLDTKYHDVGIDGLRYDDFIMHELENCENHQARQLNKCCLSCERLICAECDGHQDHEILDIGYEQLLIRKEKKVQFLLHVKKNPYPNVKGFPATSNFFLSKRSEINKEDITKLLLEITIDTKERQVGNEQLLVRMPSPVLKKSFPVGESVYHMSFATTDMIWISDQYGFTILTDTTGDPLCVLLNNMEPWVAKCVYSSHSNGDLLVGVLRYDRDKNKPTKAKVVRYIRTGKKYKYKQVIGDENKDKRLYGHPLYITENHNGDIIVSDQYHAVVVTNRKGKHRFSYTGPPKYKTDEFSFKGPLPRSRLLPLGLCVDALSNILVSDANSKTIQIIDKDGLFISHFFTEQRWKNAPRALCYNNKNHLLLVGTSDHNDEICIYRYIQRKEVD